MGRLLQLCCISLSILGLLELSCCNNHVIASAQVWPGTWALLKLIDQFRESIRGCNVLELGSGTGLAGLYTAATCAAHVLLTDVPSNIELLRRNVLANARDSDATCTAFNTHLSPCNLSNSGDVPPLVIVVRA